MIRCKEFNLSLCYYCKPESNYTAACIMNDIKMDLVDNEIESITDFIKRIIRINSNYAGAYDCKPYLPTVLEKFYPQFVKIYEDIDKYMVLI